MATTKAEMKILTKLDDMFHAAQDHETWKDFTKNATKDFEFKEGNQWTSTEEKELEDRGQAPIVENEIKPTMDRLKGQYQKMKTRIIYRGRNLNDEKLNDLFSDGALYVQQNNGYEFEEGEMFDDGTTCGFSAMEVFVEFDDMFQPEIKMKYADSLEVFPDPNSKRYDWNEDANFICRAKWVELKEAQELYPDKKKELLAYVNQDTVENDASSFRRDNYFDSRLKRVRLVETWYKKKRREMLAYVNGEWMNVTDWKKSDLKLVADAPQLDRIRNKIMVGVHCADILLEHKPSPYKHNLFPFVPYFVYRKKNGEPYSIVRLLIDPQSEINKRLSKSLHLLSTNRAVFETGAIKDVDNLAKEMSKPDGIIEYRTGKKFEIQQNIELAQTQMLLLTESKTAIRRISGINDESMGFRSEIRSGVGLQRKQAMTDLIITPIFDNLRRTRQMIGKLIMELIKQYWTEDKFFYVTDDLNKARSVGISRQQIETFSDIDYDTIVEEMPDTTTIQDEQFRIISETMQALPVPPQMAPVLFKMMTQLSQIRDKEAIIQAYDQMQQNAPSIESPKVSLSLQWAALQPEEKAMFAEKLGYPQLAQWEVQDGAEPDYQTKEDATTERQVIGSQADIIKETLKVEGNTAKARQNQKQ